jgi:hypothetical protein
LYVEGEAVEIPAGTPHGSFGFNTPEDHEIHAQYLKFIDKHLADRSKRMDR